VRYRSQLTAHTLVREDKLQQPTPATENWCLLSREFNWNCRSSIARPFQQARADTLVFSLQDFPVENHTCLHMHKINRRRYNKTLKPENFRTNIQSR